MSAIANHLDAATATNPASATEPTSQIGNDRIKLNAVKSGIYAQTVVLHSENQAAFEAMGESLAAYWQPINQVEREAVQNIQIATWRHNRAVALDFALFALGAREQIETTRQQFPDKSPDAQFVLAEAAGYRANLRAIDQLSRQEGRLFRALERACMEMVSLVAGREPCELPPSPPADAQPAPSPSTSPITPPATAPATTGFVSTKYPANMPAFVGKKAKQHRRLWLIKHGISNSPQSAPLV